MVEHSTYTRSVPGSSPGGRTMKFSKKFNQLIDFIQFTHEFQEIIRVARPPYRERFENDAEHSYQLAVVSWFLIEQDKLELNKELCFMYALAHDLVEVYAGDTYFLDKDHGLSKKKREEKALKKIKNRFSTFKTLSKMIEQYEKKSDQESNFIYALDKIIPPIQIYLENGKLWKEKEVFLMTYWKIKIKKFLNLKLSISTGKSFWLNSQKIGKNYFQKLISL